MPKNPETLEIFNRPEVVAKGWYLVCPSRAIARGQARSFPLCGQRIVVFRGADGQVRALEAYCPHMGTDLGIGQVEGNQIRCFFHHWAFDGEGRCRDIPCQAAIPGRARLPAYATEEKYGFIWVYPEAIAPQGVAEFDELRGKAVIAVADRPLVRRCHHHICMMNGIDAQHLQTVHGLNVDLSLELTPHTGGTQIDFVMRGEFPRTTWLERLGDRLLGPRYAYAMRYADACVGLLTLMKDVRRLPPLHMIYAYRPTPEGAWVQPIYVTERRSGPWGWLVSHALLLLTRLCYYRLRGEDGQIYDNIQFHADNLLAMDQPIAAYIRYVNGLEPSRWSAIARDSGEEPSAAPTPRTSVSQVFPR